jgi:hypothetical protein
MIVTFPSRTSAPCAGAAPERRRVVIIGADAAGITAALHIGEHGVLLERRAHVGAIFEGTQAQGGFDDCKSNVPMGPAGARDAGHQDLGADRARQGVSTWERQAIARACAPGHGETGRQAGEESDTVVVARWIPPRLDPVDEPAIDSQSRASLESLVPLLRGELRLRTRVVRIAPAAHAVELADGRTIVYDKLVSSLQSIELIGLLQPELPDRIRSHQGLMYWLAARDVELIDDSTQFILGDVNAFAAGRRVAETVKRALAQKFRPATEPFARGEQLFKPRLVDGPFTGTRSH